MPRTFTDTTAVHTAGTLPKRTPLKELNPLKDLKECSDNELVIRYIDGEERAFGELSQRYHPRLVNFLTRRTGDRERAEDMAQETFLRVFRHIHRFDTSKKFSTWIYTIASNLGKNELRNRSRNPLVLYQTLSKNKEAGDAPLEWEDPKYRPDDLYRKRHLEALVASVADRLPEHHRKVFLLREMQGKTYEEIAELTGTKVGTVKSRLNRARNSFALIIEPMLN